MIAIEFDLLELEREILEQRIRKQPILREVLVNDLSQMLRRDMVHIVGSERNLVLSIFGTPGCGKSHVGLYLDWVLGGITGNELTPERVWETIHFSRGDCNDALKKAAQHDLHALDEQTRTWGMGSGREAARLKNIEATVRKKQIHFLFISPELVESHPHHFILEPAGRGNLKMGLTHTRSILYTAGGDPIGVVITGLVPKEIRDAYEDKKDAFIESMLAGEEQDRAQMYSMMATEMLLIIARDFTKTMIEQKVMEHFPDLTSGETKHVAGLVVGSKKHLPEKFWLVGPEERRKLLQGYLAE